jgi:inosine/xanthosine triphosphate pyrophosphatase family protein
MLFCKNVEVKALNGLFPGYFSHVYTNTKKNSDKGANAVLSLFVIWLCQLTICLTIAAHGHNIFRMAPG